MLKLYLLYFVFCFALHCFSGLLLSTIKPPFIFNRIDLTKNLIYNIGIQNYFNNQWLLVLLDGLYFLLPWLLFFTYKRKSSIKYWLAAFIIAYNIAYISFLGSMLFFGFESLLGWIVVPLIFTSEKEKSIYFSTNIVRYYFLFFFFSVGVWKIVEGSIFNLEQMSAILVLQHKNILLNSPHSFEVKCFKFLIENKFLSYTLLASACALQLAFFIGFFTKKFDKILAIVYLIFVIVDYYLMQINYFNSLIFLLPLLYASKLKLYDNSMQKTIVDTNSNLI